MTALSDLSRRLEQLDRVSVRIFYLDLSTARPDFHLIAKTNAGRLQRLDARGEIAHSENYAVPSTGLLCTTIGQRARPRGPGTTQENEWANRIASRLVGNNLQDAIRTLQQVRAAMGAPTGSIDHLRRPRSTGARRRMPGVTKRRSSP